MTLPGEPKRNAPQNNTTIYKVFGRVREALFALPTYFRSDTSIEGILATDIFTLFVLSVFCSFLYPYPDVCLKLCDTKTHLLDFTIV